MTMFSTLKDSAESRKRRGVAFTCGLLSEVLVLGAAVFFGILFPNELPINNKHYAVTWLPDLTPPEKPVVQPPRVIARVFIPKLKLSETPKLIAPPEADPEVPKIRQTVAALALRAGPRVRVIRLAVQEAQVRNRVVDHRILLVSPVHPKLEAVPTLLPTHAVIAAHAVVNVLAVLLLAERGRSVGAGEDDDRIEG